MDTSRAHELQFSTMLPALIRNLSSTQRGWKQAISVTVDVFLVQFSLWAALSLTAGEPLTNLQHFYHLFIILPLVSTVIFTSLGIYRWIVRSSNIRLSIQLVKCSAASAAGLLVLIFLFPSEGTTPRSIIVIYGLLLFATTSALRILWRDLFSTGRHGVSVAIYGAGSAGTQLASSLSSGSEFRPVCFIDDDKSLTKSTLLGNPVLFGNSDQLQASLLKLKVSQIVIAIPSLNADQYQAIVSRLEKLNIPFKTIPSFAELVSGRAILSEIRDISIHDILGRNEVLPDQDLLRQTVGRKSILVTGGGGSIGSELCRQIVRLGPCRLTVLDNSEANLYHIGEEISTFLASSMDLEPIEFNCVLCSVADKDRVKALFENEKFHTVYHAAAYKHVPIIERFPEQAIRVNVFGTRIVLEAAIASEVENFVLISSDKAVRPTNAMGASKRVAELLLQAKAKQSCKTTISMVRFGNVLASTGSVVPKFRKQILAGGPVTLTDLNITRYFMTIPEASQLVIQSTAIARSGEVFVLDMGEPIRIAGLAETMIKLHNRQVEQAGGIRKDIEIKVVGLRPGEKMYEELFINDSCHNTSVAKVMSANEQYLQWSILKPLLDELKIAPIGLAPATVKQQLMNIAFHAEQENWDSEVKAIPELVVVSREMPPESRAVVNAN